MIIYQDTKAGFVDDIANNYFGTRLEDAFLLMATPLRQEEAHLFQAALRAS
jgi:hypothetical protein